jgi:putative endonuclease
MEQQVVRYLRQQGWQIIGCNMYCHSGEADVVARDGETLVIVEVKAGVGRGAHAPAVRVGAVKQRKLAKVAEELQRRQGMAGRSVRVDVVEVLTDERERIVSMQHYRGVLGDRGKLT